MPVGVVAGRNGAGLAGPESELQLRLSFGDLLCDCREPADRPVQAFNQSSAVYGLLASHAAFLLMNDLFLEGSRLTVTSVAMTVS